jgi:1,4-alpha-glucan branching enzyme
MDAVNLFPMASIFPRGRIGVLVSNRQAGCAAGLLVTLLVAASVTGQSSRPGMGATPYADVNGTGVTFRVWSPNATNVQVRGSFNGWGSTAMVEEGASDLWSVDVSGVANGAQYKYFINNTHWWKDPRSRQVTQSGYNSPNANSIVYFPNAFNWAGDTRLTVNRSDLVIYEMHIGSFYDPPGGGSPGKFADAIAKLDHLADLGVNAVELLPLAEFPGDYSWGYNPADIFAVENAGYGGPDGLKNFVKAAHARGIRVLLDVVHNHWGPNDFELYGFDTGSANRFYVYTTNGLCCTPWGDRPNYASLGVRNFIKDNFRMWLDEYHVDGFRWDAVGAMRRYDAGTNGYLSIPEADTLIQEIHASIIDNNAISIAEDDALGMSFDAEWDRGFGDNLINQVTKANDADRDMNALWNGINGSGFFRVVYTETHDLAGNLNGAGAQRLPKRIDSAVPDSYAARKRSMLAAAVVLTMPGTPMLFMGQEMLEDEQFADNNPLDWAHTNSYAGVVNFYRDLIHLRRNLDGVSWGLTGPNVSSHVVRNDAPWKLLAFHRWGAGPDDQVMVVMNFTSNTISNYVFSGWPVNGAWYVNLNSDWSTYSPDFGNYGSSVVQVAGGSGSVSVGPYSTLVLSRQALPELDSDGDGLLNGWEQEHFSDPLAAVATQDSDNDGANNLTEQGADTDPNSAASVLKFIQISHSGGNLNLQWQGGTSVRQVIQKSDTLPGAWINLHTNAAPTAVTNSLVIPSAPSDAAYYRIKAGP